MIRDTLRRLAHDALRDHEHRRDASQVCVYRADWVLPGDAAPLRDGAVALDRDGRVLALGSARTLQDRFRWAQWAELGGVLLPGLVDARARLELAVDEPPRGLGLGRRLRALREAAQASEALDPASREARIRHAVRRSVGAGNAAVGDVTDSLRAVPAMAREGLYGVVFHELSETRRRRVAKALAAAAVQRAGIVPWPDGILYRLAVGGLVSFAGQTARELVQLAAQGGGPLLAALEALAERDDDLSRADELARLGAHVALVGMRAVSSELAARAARDAAPVVLTPRADRQAGESPAPLVRLLEAGCHVALGTESSWSAPDGSVLREAAELHATWPEVPSLVLLRAATAGGAEALGLDTLGSLQPGSTPGLLVARAVRTPDDPCGWLLEAQPELAWVRRPAPPAAA